MYCEIVNGERCSCPSPQHVHLFKIKPEEAEIDVARAGSGHVVLNLQGVIAIRDPGTDRNVEADERFHRELAFEGRGYRDLATLIRDRSPGALDAEAEGDATPPPTDYLDKQKRKWVLRIWTLKAEDYVVVSLARKLPGANLALMNMVPTAAQQGAILQLQIAANLGYACGTE